jgi:hypothetical protein
MVLFFDGQTPSRASNIENSALRVASGCFWVTVSSEERCAGVTSVDSRLSVRASSTGRGGGGTGLNVETIDTVVLDSSSESESMSADAAAMVDVDRCVLPSKQFAGRESKRLVRRLKYVVNAGAGSAA